MMAWLGMLCTIGKDACSSHGDGADGQGSEHHGALLDNFGWEAISAVAESGDPRCLRLKVIAGRPGT